LPPESGLFKSSLWFPKPAVSQALKDAFTVEINIESGAVDSSNGEVTVHRRLYEAQHILYDYFLKSVQTEQPAELIRTFRTLFLYQTDSMETPALSALYTLVSANAQDLCLEAIKRICYILINNWNTQRHYTAISALFEVFVDPVLHRSSASAMLTRLRCWLIKFIQSQDFQELQLYRPDLQQNSESWTKRYTSYLLAAQSYNTKNPYEQRLAAQSQSRQQRERFKFSLAMYTAYGRQHHRKYENPTTLDSNILMLIRKLLVRRGKFDYKHLATLFLAQSKQAKFSSFKQGFLRYLLLTVVGTPAEGLIQRHLGSRLQEIYPHRDLDVIDEALLLRMANRVIDTCTIESTGRMSPLLQEALATKDVLTPTILLLRIVLVSPRSQSHLDVRIAALIELHALKDEASCHDFIQFLEVLRIASTIHLQDVEYNLVTMKKAGLKDPSNPSETAEYRFFSHHRSDQTVSL
jgi:hypothetical protein